MVSSIGSLTLASELSLEFERDNTPRSDSSEEVKVTIGFEGIEIRGLLPVDATLFLLLECSFSVIVLLEQSGE